MTRRTLRRRAGPTVEQLVERFDEFGREDAGYRRLTLAVRRALRLLLPRLDERALARYMAVEEAMLAREVYSTDAVAQWAYWLGRRDALMPTPKVRVRKRAVTKRRRLRGARLG